MVNPCWSIRLRSGGKKVTLGWALLNTSFASIPLSFAVFTTKAYHDHDVGGDGGDDGDGDGPGESVVLPFPL